MSAFLSPLSASTSTTTLSSTSNLTVSLSKLLHKPYSEDIVDRTYISYYSYTNKNSSNLFDQDVTEIKSGIAMLEHFLFQILTVFVRKMYFIIFFVTIDVPKQEFS